MISLRRSPVVLVIVAIVGLAACSAERGTTPTPVSATAGTTTGPGSSATAPSTSSTPDADAARLSRLVGHLGHLQTVAESNNGNRAAGTSGYEQSAQYVESQLVSRGFQPQRHTFSYTVRPTSNLTHNGTDVISLPLQGSEAGTVTGRGTTIIGDGCSPLGYLAVPARAIAVVQRGGCSFEEKARQAKTHGAVAIIVVNNARGEAGDKPFYGSIGKVTGILGVVVGRTAVLTGNLKLTVNSPTTVQSFSITAETTTGDPHSVVMAGAHLDSVPEGPGINDDGTGVATVLDLALTTGPSPSLAHRLRFAFWGAEEEGLIGSTNYVRALGTEISTINKYLNFDMLGSNNAGYLTYDDNSEIEEAFTKYFAALGIAVDSRPFDGRSDYDEFRRQGVAVGGIETGADGVKTPEQQRKWGGTAGITFDTNYHQPTDTLSNVNQHALTLMSGAAQHVVLEFAAAR